MKGVHNIIVLVLLAFFVSSCSGGGGGSGGRGGSQPVLLPPQPDGFTYTELSSAYIAGVRVVPNEPSFTQGAPDLFLIEPPLPPGLGLNAEDGRITGTPSALSESALYTVTAWDSSSATVDLTIEVVAPTPDELEYDLPVAIYLVGIPVEPNAPTNPPPLATYSVEPELPAGLELDTDSGSYDGSPEEATETASYTLTATTDGAETQTSIVVITTCRFEYESPVVYIPDAEILENGPTSGHAFMDYTIEPDLPTGLTLDPETGVIQGTPTSRDPPTVYTVTGVTASGLELEASVQIAVSSVYEFIADDTEVVYSTDSGFAEFVVDLRLVENPDNPGFPNALAGLEMSLAHDPDLLDPILVSLGSDFLDLNDGDGPFFFGSRFLEGGISLGVIPSLSVGEMIVMEESLIVAHVDYQTNASALINNEDGASTILTWMERPEAVPSIGNFVMLGGAILPIDAQPRDGVVELIPDSP